MFSVCLPVEKPVYNVNNFSSWISIFPDYVTFGPLEMFQKNLDERLGMW